MVTHFLPYGDSQGASGGQNILHATGDPDLTRETLSAARPFMPPRHSGGVGPVTHQPSAPSLHGLGV
jgi:hypothetical protein